MENSWQLSIKLEKETLENIEGKCEIVIPKDLKNFLLLNNGSIPILKSFNTDSSKNEIINNILDFNINSSESFQIVHNSIKDYIPVNFLPFARDGFGNYICILQDNKIIFYNHETQKTSVIAKNFQDFIKGLH